LRNLEERPSKAIKNYQLSNLNLLTKRQVPSTSKKVHKKYYLSITRQKAKVCKAEDPYGSSAVDKDQILDAFSLRVEGCVHVFLA
jgi:hypothetical protein